MRASCGAIISFLKRSARYWAMNDQERSGVALVTGASRGIGRAIAVALGQNGWDVVINYRGNSEAAQAAAQEVESVGGRAFLIQADIGNAGEREKLVQETLDRCGRIDLLVNNAG